MVTSLVTGTGPEKAGRR